MEVQSKSSEDPLHADIRCTDSYQQAPRAAKDTSRSHSSLVKATRIEKVRGHLECSNKTRKSNRFYLPRTEQDKETRFDPHQREHFKARCPDSAPGFSGQAYLGRVFALAFG